MANPVRIYVLHHPDSKFDPVSKVEKGLAEGLTNRIYDWFRMPSLEGIPVYIRSLPPAGEQVPILPDEKDPCLSYLVPLVDAHMVRDAAWHDYLVTLINKCCHEHDGATKGWVMFPVALDNTAFNLPAVITQRNFVRYIVPTTISIGAQKKEAAEKATLGVLKDLTEAMSRDLNARLFPAQAGRKLKIFISYARADGSEVPKAMRDYIQGRTQCEAFLDENDIGFGSKYDNVLDESAGEQSRALIVVAGDNYADRPVCRWEIRKFTEPDPLPLSGAKTGKRHIHVFHPIMVLNTQSGMRITRVLPELGQAPSLRWDSGREALCFSMLMREVLFGARNVLAARAIASKLPQGIVLNRLPGPVALQRLLGDQQEEATVRGRPQIHYPGNGLPLMELRLLERTFKNARLKAFRDVGRHLPATLSEAMSTGRQPLHGKVIGISYGFSEELNSLGYLTQHLEEALIYLLRPLLRLGVDIMYGGLLPKRDQVEKGTGRNMTVMLMNLLNDEISVAGIEGVREKRTKAPVAKPSRLFNPTSWPVNKGIAPEDEATWISSCSIYQVKPKHADLEGAEPEDKTPRYRAWQGLVLSRFREIMGEGFDCPVPGDSGRRVQPSIMVFVGGKMAGFYGSVPGIMEEFYWAVKHQRPIFLLGGFGGATGALTNVLLSDTEPDDGAFHTDYYRKSDGKLGKDDPTYTSLLQGYEEMKVEDDRHPNHKLKALWDLLVQARTTGTAKLCRNGLSEDDNRKLMGSWDAAEAVHLIWQGLSALFDTEIAQSLGKEPS